MQTYLEPTQESGRALFKRGIPGEVVMLNLLRLREVADYSASPELAPAQPISGAEAYDRYIAHTVPYLAESGGEVLFLGKGGPFLIVPRASGGIAPCSCGSAPWRPSWPSPLTMPISPASDTGPRRSRTHDCCPWSRRRSRSHRADRLRKAVVRALRKRLDRISLARFASCRGTAERRGPACRPGLIGSVVLRRGARRLSSSLLRRFRSRSPQGPRSDR